MPEVLFFKSTGRYDTEVVGESYYQEHLSYLAEMNEDYLVETVDLFLEDYNKHDNQTVAVSVEGEDVGHLSREDARRYRAGLKALGYPTALGSCAGKLTGGHELENGEQASFGIVLDLDLDHLEVRDIGRTKSDFPPPLPPPKPQPQQSPKLKLGRVKFGGKMHFIPMHWHGVWYLFFVLPFIFIINCYIFIFVGLWYLIKWPVDLVTVVVKNHELESTLRES
jgi:hypothetical protein